MPSLPIILILLTLSGRVLFAAANPSVRDAETEKDVLGSNFQNPPDSAKPQTWWHWVDGNITREGITADLEAMKHVGLGGAQLFDVSANLPAGPVAYGSAEWRSLVKHALEEACRLGLDMGIHNCAGWSSSGGPWVTPEYGMQEAVMSEFQTCGPAHVETKLPLPPFRLGYYRDIAVLAFPSSSGKPSSLSDHVPKITTSSPLDFKADALLDDKADTAVCLPLPTPDTSQYIQFAFAQSYPARRLVIDPGPLQRGFDGEFQASDDGVHFRKILAFSLPYGTTVRTFGFPEVSCPYYRLVMTKPARTYYPNLALAGIKLDMDFRLENLEQKAAFQRADSPIIDPREVRVPEDTVIPLDAIRDLSDKLKPDGTLTWDVPEGHWTVLRIGHTPTGEKNHPARPGGTGLECDKLSRKAVETFWTGMMAGIVKDAGPLAGKTLTNILVDSYELKSANWTADFREEFLTRRGYDPAKYLPALTGRVVGSGEITERFLWDFRRTLADLFAENYAGTLAALAEKNGLVLALEPYGSSPAEDLLYARPAAIPMTEFWADQTPSSLACSTSLPASAAHIYGHSLVGAEAFTGRPANSSWTSSPATLKPVGDAAYCSGINRFYFHTFAHQPWLDRAPGMTMGMWGSHFDRTNTWWEQSAAWIRYLSRCQFLLQQGRFVADVLYFCGEGAPVGGRPNTLPPGYRYDQCNADVILSRMSARDGFLELSGGQTYRLLVLPPERQMTPRLLRKIGELVRKGATVIGPKPVIAPGLKDYPKCDEEVASLAEEIWGNCDGQSVTGHSFGKGSVIWGNNLAQVLSDMQLPPDFETNSKEAQIRFVHRSTGDAEIYFVANLQETSRQVKCTFRVNGKIPEIWNPGTGSHVTAPVYHEFAGRTVVPLSFEPSGSTFVIFRKDRSTEDHLVPAQGTTDTTKEPFALTTGSDGHAEMQALQPGTYHFESASKKKTLVEIPDIPLPVAIPGPWQVGFPPKHGAPENVTLDHLVSWSTHANPGVRYFSGTATYKKDVDIPENLLGKGRGLYLDLGSVQNIARVRLNGTDLGILWKSPFRVWITDAVHPGQNRLEIEITNLWPNRLIGDEQLPADCEWHPQRFKDEGETLKEWPRWLLEGKASPTGRIAFGAWRHWHKDDALLPSGLLGPVQLVSVVTKRVE